MIGDWGLGIGDWGLGIGPNPQSPIPNSQSPLPHIYIIKNHNINRENHLMYNATLNNDYDSYPTQEEYKAYMDKIGQKNYSYCGGPPMPGRSFIKVVLIVFELFILLAYSLLKL